MTPADRLKQARIAARYKTAADAAAAMGVKYSTYSAHENGEKGLSRAADRYARFFRVSKVWLLDGTGTMKGEIRAVPVMGKVLAGSGAPQIENGLALSAREHVEIPEATGLGALVVEGRSQWPKWIDGDIILYELEPVRPAEAVDQYAIVETVNGERLIKMLRKSGRPGFWTLESHNAPPEEAELLAAYRYVLTLAAPAHRALPVTG